MRNFVFLIFLKKGLKMNQISFKQRVINDLITVAPQFKSNFIDKEYLIFSSKMMNVYFG